VVAHLLLSDIPLLKDPDQLATLPRRCRAVNENGSVHGICASSGQALPLA
jgi:hypothetical protein